MFVNTCTACGDRRLVFPSEITGIDNTPAGITVGYDCACGAHQTKLTGRIAA